MTNNDYKQTRTNIAAMLLQGMLETEESWAKRVVDSLTYRRMAKHAVKLTDTLLDELEYDEEEGEY